MIAGRASVRERAKWDDVRYANVWEDGDVLRAALEPVARGRRVLSIASAGDNVLALLTLDPAEVVAVDLSSAQLACLELRMAAFRRLEHAEVLAFLGVTSGENRRATYGRLRGDLSTGAQGFWDTRARSLEEGIIHGGKFERYFELFRRRVLPLIHGARTVADLRAPRPLAEQEEFYRRRWDTWRWRLLFRVFFSRVVLGRMGRDPAFFAHAEGPVSARILERSRHALTDLPVATNPWLAFIVTGNFNDEALPPYLRAEHFATIRSRLDRVRVVEGAVDTAAAGRFHGFNLSDLFEYMDADEHRACYQRLIDAAEPGARLVYWNMLVPRGVPAGLAERVTPSERLAAELHARDRAWFYGGFHIDEVRA